ncbi:MULTISPECIES: protein kinase domain-containing protein [Thermus]|jgi:outer membrane protein assembly factor BamB|uniref:non-specific serine/threonine protein kinase n=1 Tax=Thermus brockianus TaxID=56956 RepID=A0A1J0LR47_THEBO|nr:serine/threonine-protein kinase [Thermus brockianus]APD08774.1 serine/threonine protein kinase [Thermus brockianus]
MTRMLLAGRYRLEAPLGSGGMAEVWQALDERLGRRVAVKLLHPRALPPERERFLLEVRALSRLFHPGIVQVLDLGEEEGRPYFVMELVEGGTFDRLGPFEEGPEGDRILLAAAQVMEALAHLHAQGILHRDLTPKNILLTKEGYPKVMDFGLAYLLQESRHLTRTGYTLGTPTYMAPEQAKGLPLTPKADLYSLGAVLYRTLTGRPPFEGENDQAVLYQHVYEEPKPPEALNPAIPKGVGQAVLGLLAKHPEERPAHPDLFHSALREFQALRLATPRAGASRSGHYPLAPDPRRLALKGKLDLGGEAAWPGEMVHAGGRVYLGVGRGLVEVDLLTGEVRREALPEEVTAPPVVRGGVYVGSWDGKVRRFRGRHLEWFMETGAEVTAAPLALGERVYVASRDGTLYAFHKDAPLFRFRAGGHLSASPTFYRGLLFVGSEDGWLYALDPETGALRYKVRTGPIHAPVAAGRGLLFIPTWEGEVYAFDPLSRETLWNAAVEGEIWGGLALDGERVYVAAWDGVLRALDAATGEEVWSLEVGKVTAGLSYASGHVFVATEEDRFLAVDRRGQVVFEATGLGAVQVPPLPLPGEVLVASLSGKLYRFAVG